MSEEDKNWVENSRRRKARYAGISGRFLDLNKKWDNGEKVKGGDLGLVTSLHVFLRLEVFICFYLSYIKKISLL